MTPPRPLSQTLDKARWLVARFVVSEAVGMTRDAVQISHLPALRPASPLKLGPTLFQAANPGHLSAKAADEHVALSAQSLSNLRMATLSQRGTCAALPVCNFMTVAAGSGRMMMCFC